MKYQVVKTRRFKTAYKRIKNTKSFKIEVYSEVIDTLASGRKLDAKFKDHRLTGNLKDLRECHLSPDILLIYKINNGILTLTLVNIGNHSQLFR